MPNKLNFAIAASLEQKPYNRCINCEHIGVNCDGPNFFAMTLTRLAEWCRVRKEFLGLTNAEIADKALMSKTTVDRFLAGHVDDLKYTTIQSILKVLVNGTWGQYPCVDPDTRSETATTISPLAMQKIEGLEKENCRLLKEIEYLKADNKRKDDLIDKKDSLIEKLATKG